MFNFFMKQVLGSSPKINSIAEYLNILGKFDEKTLLTKDENLVRGFKIKGLSYIAMGVEKEAGLHSDRFSFINKIGENVECLVFLRREKSTLNSDSDLRSDNPYANKIIDIWEKDFRLADINYYLLISTKKENMIDKVDKKIDDKQQRSFDFKTNRLENFSENLKQFLREYSVEELSADELASFYASILNGEETRIDCDRYLFDDYFVSADIEFKKNYMIRTLPTKEIYSSIISITTYDGNFICRKDLTNILQVDSNLLISIGFLQLNKRRAGGAISNATMKTRDGSVHGELEKIKVAVDEDKVKLFEVAINILVSEDTQEKMEQTIANIVAICKKNQLLTKRESLAQKSIFLSFFPSLWEKCNMRKRVQTTGVLTTYLSFENDLTGINFNPWGNKAVAVLKNSIQRPYLFNFHLPIEEGEDREQLKAGHTLVIGGTGSGKTTLIEFLITGLFKYENLNIFALDKHHGMSVFTHFVDGEYHDVGSDFKLNPFSLDHSDINRNFLQVFLETLAGLRGRNTDIDIDSTEEKKNLIREALNRVIEYTENPEDKTFSNFLLSLESDKALQTRFEKWKGGILDNCEDALDFSKKLAVLNMDNILKDQDLTSIVAYYIFHKLINKSVSENKGFFIFIDELREYLGNPEMAHQIITLILEARKLNGVVCMGVQNVDFFEEMVGEKLANAFLSNIAHFVIYPTSDTKNLENLQKRIGLTNEEIDFLKTTPMSERKALIKQGVANSQQIKASVVVDLNLKSLKEYIKVFSSSAKDVAKMKELRLSYQEQWREKFLSG